MDTASILLAFGVVLASLTVHEWAHAWSADRLGDPTARLLGRVSFNPVVHIDPIGTLLLPLLAMFSGFPILGWAKPVPVNVSQLGNPKRDFMIVAAAGPASNLVMAVVAAVGFHAVGGFAAAGPDFGIVNILFMAVSINLLLAVFNLLPIPPLDGGNVLAGLLPDSMAGLLYGLRRFGFIILYALLFTGVLFRLIGPPVAFLRGLLL
ncbi:MAG TPA: site-2 protease family protein [Vicinamibacterales bacterium]|nr:site-2 protease family protein [Vicinamibacterales bacterium]